MSNIPEYEFTAWHEHHGGMQSHISISKRVVWEKLKNDKDFWNMKLYKIKVKQISNQSTSGMGVYVWPGYTTYVTGQHWAKNLAEAKQIGEVIEQIHPKPKAKPAPPNKEGAK